MSAPTPTGGLQLVDRAPSRRTKAALEGRTRRNRPAAAAAAPAPASAAAASVPAPERTYRSSTTSSRHAARSVQASRPLASPAIAATPDAASKQKLQKRHQIATACDNCREAKIKCSGHHPQCTRCRARRLVCAYDVAEEGVTRREWLRRQFARQARELERCNAVLNYLRTGSDAEAASALACLRMGDSVEDLYASLPPPALQPPPLPPPPQTIQPPLPLPQLQEQKQRLRLRPRPQQPLPSLVAGRKDSVTGGDSGGMGKPEGPGGLAGGSDDDDDDGGGGGSDGRSAYSTQQAAGFEGPSPASLPQEWPEYWDPAMLEVSKMRTSGLWNMDMQETMIMDTEE